MRYEERVAWACAVALMALIAGVCAWRLGEAQKAPQAPPPEAGLRARLEALERQADAAEARRCYAVEKMDLTIYPVENLGRKVVAP